MPKIRPGLTLRLGGAAALAVAILVVAPSLAGAVNHGGSAFHLTRARVSRCHGGRGPVAIAALSSSGPCSRRTSTPRLRAPHLRVVHRVLRWSPLPGVTTYNVAIIRRTGPRLRTGHQIVAATFFRARPVPGSRVRYRVAANVPHARWTRPVNITWPRAASASPYLSSLSSGPTATPSD
jgi:hypothetical protein